MRTLIITDDTTVPRSDEPGFRVAHLFDAMYGERFDRIEWRVSDESDERIADYKVHLRCRLDSSGELVE